MTLFEPDRPCRSLRGSAQTFDLGEIFVRCHMPKSQVRYFLSFYPYNEASTLLDYVFHFGF